jgi:hypothetical protein
VYLDGEEIACADLNWIYLAQVMFQWWGVANMVMKIRVP